MTPPEVSLPGPFATAHFWTALAAYPSKESSSNDFCTETNPHLSAKAQAGSDPKRASPFKTERN
ncbi:MAG: hypothetical protein A3G93_03880 [Nitrospinae bacterium RIFCSPLOWO2_12_FULL_45_22]|nr:MAG: hypothetical protein A3G93_03880 [Nitrospinae bacterium RIFCSPLOWO2_12_FULL_45_22]